MGCKLRRIDRELLENHSPTFWRFLKELQIVLHIKEMYFIKQKCSEHYALFLRVTIDLYKITVIAETCSMRRRDRVGSIRETFLCLRVQMSVLRLETRSAHFHSSANCRSLKNKNKSVFFTILFSSMRFFCCVMYTLQYSTQI